MGRFNKRRVVDNTGQSYANARFTQPRSNVSSRVLHPRCWNNRRQRRQVIFLGRKEKKGSILIKKEEGEKKMFNINVDVKRPRSISDIFGMEDLADRGLEISANVYITSRANRRTIAQVSSKMFDRRVMTST